MIYIEKYCNGDQNFFVVKDDYSDYIRFEEVDFGWQHLEFEIFGDEEGFFQQKLAPSTLDRW